MLDTMMEINIKKIYPNDAHLKGRDQFVTLAKQSGSIHKIKRKQLCQMFRMLQSLMCMTKRRKKKKVNRKKTAGDKQYSISYFNSDGKEIKREGETEKKAQVCFVFVAQV